jgi:gluconolactonase
VTPARHHRFVPIEPVVLREGLGFAEGPVVTRSGDVVAVSVDQGFVCRLAADGRETVTDVGGGPNGATEGEDGSIFIANNGRGVTPPPDGADPPSGRVDVISESGEVGRLGAGMVSPNDLCFGPDGLLYVTDPTRPIGSHDSRIWRVDPATGASEQIAVLGWYANGIGFAAEDDWLYVADSDGARIVRFRLEARLSEPDVVVTLEHGRPDGFAFDAEGNVIVGAVMLERDRPGEIQTWSLDGELVDVVALRRGHLCTNVFLTADAELLVTVGDTGELLRYRGWPSRGLPLHPFRSGQQAPR